MDDAMTDAEFDAFFEDAMRFFQQIIAEIEAMAAPPPVFAGDAASV